MGYNEISGDSEHALALAGAIKRNVGIIDEKIGEMDSLLKSLSSGWNDEKYNEVVEVVGMLKTIAQGMNDNLTQILPRLDHYADYLMMLYSKGLL